ncbi:MAG: AsmA-like C-terminal region-containing protein [Planctomycetota bacterium]
MARKRFTPGRAVALIFLGVAIAGVLYVSRHLSPETLEIQVRAAIDELVRAEYEIDDVVLDPTKGIELRGLRIFYDRKRRDTAIEAERIVLIVNHQKLLRGKVEITQVDLYGIRIRLRPEAGDVDGAPSLPGIFNEPSPDSEPIDLSALPLINVHSGVAPSRIELHGLPMFNRREPLAFNLVHARGQPDGPQYSVQARAQGRGLATTSISISFQPDAGIAQGLIELHRVEWNEDTPRMFHAKARKALRPLRLRGEASGRLEFVVDLKTPKLRSINGTAKITSVEGDFGNVHTGNPEGFPFRFEEGSAEVKVSLDGLSVSNINGVFMSRNGQRGPITADYRTAFLGGDGENGSEVDLRFRAENLHVSVEDLRLLLPQSIVDVVIEKYLPAGTFAIDLKLKNRPDTGEHVWATLDMTDGQFEYAGRLDRYTGKRFGFRYPLQRCKAHIVAETGIPTEHGLADVITLTDIEGFHPIRGAKTGGPKDVRITASGKIVAYSEHEGAPEDVEIHVRVHDLPIDDDLALAFASSASGVPYRDFELTGSAEHVHLAITADAFVSPKTDVNYEIQLKDCTLAYKRFPVHLDGLSVRVREHAVHAPGGREERRIIKIEDLKGRLRDGGTASGSGHVLQVDGETREIDIKINCDAMKLGEDMRAAFGAVEMLDGSGADLWDRIQPEGVVRGEVRLKTGLEVEADIHLDGHVRIKGVSGIPLPIERLEGLLLYRTAGIQFKDIRGFIGESEIHAAGHVLAGGAVDLRAGMHRLALDNRFRDVCKEVSPAILDILDEHGIEARSVFDGTLRLRRAPGDKPLSLMMEATNIEVFANRRDLPVRLRGGPITIEQDLILMRDLRLDVGDARLQLSEGSLALGAGKGGRLKFQARDLKPKEHLAEFLGDDIEDVLGPNLRVDLDDFEIQLNRADGSIVLLGDGHLRRAEEQKEPGKPLAPTGAFRFATLRVTPGREDEPVRFSGLVRLREINANLPISLENLSGTLLIGDGRTLDNGIAIRGAIQEGSGKLFGRHFNRISFNLDYDPAYLRLEGIDGTLYKGSLRGNVEVFLSEPTAFEVALRADDVDLAEFLKQSMGRSSFKGKVDAAINLRSPSGATQHMAGRGELRISDGELMSIPGLRGLLSVLGSAGGSSTHFKNMEIDYRVEGEFIRLDRFRLFDATSDIYGKGSATIFGDLDLVVYPQVNKMLDLPRFLNIPVLSTIRDLFHKTVLEIRVGGTVGSPRVITDLLPLPDGRPRHFVESGHAGAAERVRLKLIP